MKKLIICFLFAAALALPAFSQQRDEDFETLQKPDGNITITAYKGGSTAVMVPLNISGLTVNEIGSGAFLGNTAIRNVFIPNSITIIGNQAFSGAANLTSIRLGSSLLSIGDEAFSGAALSSVELPASLRSIGNKAFAGNRINAVVIPDSVTRVGVDAFARNPGLSEIVLGEGLNNLFFNAFGAEENPLKIIVVKKTGVNLNSIGFEQSFVNVYSTGGAGVYIKQGNVWIKSNDNPAVYVLPSIAASSAAAPSFAPQSAGDWDYASANPRQAPPTIQAPDVSKESLIGQVYIIYFQGNSPTFAGLSAALSESNNKTVAAVSTVLKNNRSLRVRITGFANPINPSPRDEQQVLRPLSQKRAEAVAQLLDFNGISRGRMIVTSEGGAHPLARYQERSEWYRNRRVEITLIR